MSQAALIHRRTLEEEMEKRLRASLSQPSALTTPQPRPRGHAALTLPTIPNPCLEKQGHTSRSLDSVNSLVL